MINVKKKGNLGENKFYKWLRQEGIDRGAMRNPSSGSGIVKSDVVNALGINFEIKTVKKLSLLKAYNQSDRDAQASHTTPYVVIHFDGMPDDLWLMVMDNWTWKNLWLKSREDKILQPSRELKWALHSLKNAINKVSKLIK